MDNQPLPLIPYPTSLQILPGSLELLDCLEIHGYSAFQNEIDIFQETVRTLIEVRHVQRAEQASLRILQTAPQELPDGAYRLEVTPQHIALAATDPGSLFNGLQTLAQLLIGGSQAGRLPIQMPCLKIEDHPQYGWRGFMLDEARHFQGKETVKQLLDWMAFLRLNIFHWHLSDDQGWRVESKRFPLLHEVGSYRPATQRGGMLSRQVSMQSHQGYYSRDDIRELVEYARQRHITVVPEMDVPGHSSAILAAYPHLGCSGGPYQVQPYWGIHADILCAGNAETYLFLEQVMAELLEIFPGPYFHSGGDEAPLRRWRKCPQCRQRANELGYTRIRQLKTYLANHLHRFLQSQGRRMVAWNEVLAPDLDPEIIIQFWLGNKKNLQQHASQGRQIILSNYEAYYLDHTYTHSNLKKVHQFKPLFDDLAHHRASILGIEAPLWTEFVPTRTRLDWQIFPRLLAVAERAWLGEHALSYDHFQQRLARLLPHLERTGLGFAALKEVDPPFWRRLSGGISLIQEGKGNAGQD